MPWWLLPSLAPAPPTLAMSSAPFLAPRPQRDGFAGYDPYDRFSPDPDDDLGLLLPNSYFDAYPGLFPPSPTEGQGPAEGGTEAASKSAATPRCMYFARRGHPPPLPAASMLCGTVHHLRRIFLAREAVCRTSPFIQFSTPGPGEVGRLAVGGFEPLLPSKAHPYLPGKGRAGLTRAAFFRAGQFVGFFF